MTQIKKKKKRWFLYISQGSPDTQTQWDILIIGTGWGTNGEQEVPRSGICRLENQESPWYNSVLVQIPENQKLQLQRAGKGRHSSSRSEREFFLPLFFFCSIQALNGLDDAHPHYWGRFSLLSLLNQMLLSSRTPSQTNRFYQLPLRQSRWFTEWTIHTLW